MIMVHRTSNDLNLAQFITIVCPGHYDIGMEENMKMKILLSLLVVIGVLMFLSACAPSSTPAASDTTSTSLDGKALVESRCICLSWIGQGYLQDQDRN